MKLHQLEIQAFGPFAKTETIDFDALGHNPLFLIDGPTGAGKSSILHAICYALYGETTDSDRKELGLRCDHADNDLLTQLTLEFSIRGDRYRIQRVPTQMRPAKKGEGITEQKASAELSQILADGSQKTLVPKKVNDAKTHIHTIVGLTAEQFRQVMVLPQGKFRDLLLAKSDDRQAILSTLFQTDIYKQIEQRLKDKAATIERQHAAFEKSKQEALSDVAMNDIENLIEAIKYAETHCADSLKHKQHAQQAQQLAVNNVKSGEDLAKAFTERDSKQAEYTEWQAKSDDINLTRQAIKRAEKALEIAPKWQALQSINTDLANKKTEIDQSSEQLHQIDQDVVKTKAALKQAEEDYKQRDALKAQEVKLISYQATLLNYAQLEKTAKLASDDYAKATQQQAGYKQQFEAVSSHIKTLESERETLSKQLANKAELATTQLQLRQQVTQREKLDLLNGELNKLQLNQQEKNQTLQDTIKDYKQKKAHADRLELLWHTHQAAILAAELKQDEPCVVCGSLQHPNPAQLPENTPSETDVKQARQAQDACQELGAKARANAESADTAVLNKQAEIKQLSSELAELAQQKVEALTQQLNQINQQLEAIAQQEHQLEQHKQQLLALHNQQNQISASLTDNEKTLPALTNAKADALAALSSAQTQLPEQYRESSAVEHALQQTQQQINHIEQSYQTASKNKDETVKQQTALQASLVMLNANLEALTKNQAQQQNDWDKALQASEFNDQHAYDGAQLTDDTLSAYRAEVSSFDDTLNRLKAECDLLTKQLADKQLPDLEQLQTELQSATDLYQQSETAWATADKHKAELDNAHNKIKRIENQQADSKKDYEIIGTLSNAASGKGNIKVSLERFVLGNLLDSVLSIASHRLHIMSKGQYRLIRQNESDQKRNQTAGLDLAIDDAHTGKTRPVATLSGGESFMASLALALGLSDVVQERSGGIQLDTLFIDEGFGSLDQESLQLAINTLIDLQSTGRTIGLISHVSELKEQMGQRVEVVGSREGSRVRTVNG